MSNLYIGNFWPNLWTFDMTDQFTFDSTDPQWTFDGGQVRGGGLITMQDRNKVISAQTRLSVTRTENLLF